MKRTFAAILIFFILTVTPAVAQVNFGIKAGVNLSEKPTNIKGIKDGHTGWYAGPMLKAIFPIIGLGAEANVLYSESGTNVGGENFNKSSIEIPLYLRYELSLPAINKFIEPFIAIGPQWGYAFGKKEFGKKLEDVNNLEDLKEIGRYFKFNESYFSLNVGLGVILLSHLQLHVNYNIALGETSEYFGPESLKDLNFGDKIDYIKSQTNIWQISLAYIF